MTDTVFKPLYGGSSGDLKPNMEGVGYVPGTYPKSWFPYVDDLKEKAPFTQEDVDKENNGNIQLTIKNWFSRKDIQLLFLLLAVFVVLAFKKKK